MGEIPAAEEIYFWDVLSKLNIPVTVLRGTNKKSKIQSDLSDEDMEQYRSCIKKFSEVNFEYSDHMIVDEELGKYRAVVKEFMEGIKNNK